MAEGLSGRDREVLLELLKNSKISDKELAKKLSTSQPTITRIRNRLYDSGYILNYTVMPKMEKAGLKLLAFTFIRKIDPNALKKLHSWILASPWIIFSAEGEGLREARLVILSGHTDFDNFKSFMNLLRSDFGNSIEGISAFFVPSGTSIKDFSPLTPIESSFRILQKGEKVIRKPGMQIPQMPQLPSMPQVKMPRFGRKKAR